ncbi:Cysteine/O-acetylserine efflux protein [Paenibacillus polymyxa E681]|uniref:LysE family transporter n=1 Tax=Paenibacillus polymyxa TaxID=1406 RepID=UPI0001E31311|nr:LysE family transporter [Paenibacillus polymyxa]ADM68457.1 amino acid transporter LysE [Paenibacillus polymyxa E681]QNV55457.1 Cysteine/O-acetylserine efflux protein [Paenibacillus polymyxa E681]QNV60293.1 Cysteine/O-acetylserine efflux protein [Paenibacillus polymyxa E681]
MPVIPFLSYAIVTSFTPGPNNIMSLDSARRLGLRKAFPFLLGVTAGCFAIMLLACYFNLALYHFLPRVKIWMNVLGSLYMLYLAVKIAKSKPSSKNNDHNEGYSFKSGLLLQFINLKVILYGITVISTFVMPYDVSYIELITISLLLTCIGFVAVVSWAIFGAVFQRFLNKHERSFNIIMSLLLLYSALSIWM